MRGRYYYTNLQGRSQSESSHYHFKKKEKKKKKKVLPDFGWHMGHEDLVLISSFKSQCQHVAQPWIPQGSSGPNDTYRPFTCLHGHLEWTIHEGRIGALFFSSLYTHRLGQVLASQQALGKLMLSEGMNEWIDIQYVPEVTRALQCQGSEQLRCPVKGVGLHDL